MDHTKIKTLKQLKDSAYKPRSIKDELRENLIQSLRAKKTVFEGIWGYEETVIPDLERAILAQEYRNYRQETFSCFARLLAHR